MRGRRRVYRRGRRGVRRARARVVRPPSSNIGIPRMRLVTLRYADTFTLDPSVAVPLANYYYLANGLNDPQVAVGGHQPLGFDQWCQFYSKYIVIASVMRLRVANTSSLPSSSNIVGVRLTNNTSFSPPSGGWPTLIEQGRSVWRQVQSITNGNMAKMRLGYSCKRFFGINNIKDNLPLYGANAGSIPTDPTELAYFNIFAGSTDQVTDTSPCQFAFTIDYRVIFSDPRDLPQS